MSKNSNILPATLACLFVTTGAAFAQTGSGQSELNTEFIHRAVDRDCTEERAHCGLPPLLSPIDTIGPVYPSICEGSFNSRNDDRLDIIVQPNDDGSFEYTFDAPFLGVTWVGHGLAYSHISFEDYLTVNNPLGIKKDGVVVPDGMQLQNFFNERNFEGSATAIQWVDGALQLEVGEARGQWLPKGSVASTENNVMEFDFRLEDDSGNFSPVYTDYPVRWTVEFDGDVKSSDIRLDLRFEYIMHVKAACFVD